MRGKPFTWHYSDGTITTFASYRKAAGVLHVGLSTIRYYAKHDIHSEKDKQKNQRKKVVE